jgi:hypothetical protein
MSVALKTVAWIGPMPGMPGFKTKQAEILLAYWVFVLFSRFYLQGVSAKIRTPGADQVWRAKWLSIDESWRPPQRWGRVIFAISSRLLVILVTSCATAIKPRMNSSLFICSTVGFRLSIGGFAFCNLCVGAQCILTFVFRKRELSPLMQVTYI